MYGNTSAGVVVGRVLLSGSFYMCPTVQCILCSESVHSTLHEAVSSQVICKPTYSHPAVLNELFTRHLLTAQESSKVSKYRWWQWGWEWKDHLTLVLSTKTAELIQEACQVLQKHHSSVKELKSELYYSRTLCQVVFQVLYYANLIVAQAPTAYDCFI